MPTSLLALLALRLLAMPHNAVVVVDVCGFRVWARPLRVPDAVLGEWTQCIIVINKVLSNSCLLDHCLWSSSTWLVLVSDSMILVEYVGKRYMLSSPSCEPRLLSMMKSHSFHPSLGVCCLLCRWAQPWSFVCWPSMCGSCWYLQVSYQAALFFISPFQRLCFSSQAHSSRCFSR